MVASLSADRLHENGQSRDFAVVTPDLSDKNVPASIRDKRDVRAAVGAFLQSPHQGLTRANPLCYSSASRLTRLHLRQARGGAVWQLVGLITRRSQVQILPPQPFRNSS